MVTYTEGLECLDYKGFIDYNCGSPRTEDEVEMLQHWCGNAAGHRPKEESRPIKVRNESRYSIVF